MPHHQLLNFFSRLSRILFWLVAAMANFIERIIWRWMLFSVYFFICVLYRQYVICVAKACKLAQWLINTHTLDALRQSFLRIAVPHAQLWNCILHNRTQCLDTSYRLSLPQSTKQTTPMRDIIFLIYLNWRHYFVEISWLPAARNNLAARDRCKLNG